LTSSLYLTVPEIFTKFVAEDTWSKSLSSKMSWSNRKLQILLLVKKTHIFHPVKISNQLLARFMNYGAANEGCNIVRQQQ
jgi:phage-related holin